jgi:hypothetical protein
MFPVEPVVVPLAVVQQREQLHDIASRPIRARHRQTVQSHPRPVRHPVNAPPLEPELLAHDLKHIPFEIIVHFFCSTCPRKLRPFASPPRFARVPAAMHSQLVATHRLLNGDRHSIHDRLARRRPARAVQRLCRE